MHSPRIVPQNCPRPRHTTPTASREVLPFDVWLSVSQAFRVVTNRRVAGGCNSPPATRQITTVDPYQNRADCSIIREVEYQFALYSRPAAVSRTRILARDQRLSYQWRMPWAGRRRPQSVIQTVLQCPREPVTTLGSQPRRSGSGTTPATAHFHRLLVAQRAVKDCYEGIDIQTP